MIIGIGGVSNVGKSKLAQEIKNLLPDKSIQILCQDDYVRPKYEIPLIKDHVDWESPESINFFTFKDAILEANDNADVVIAEGIFVFYHPQANLLFDKRIWVEISKETFFERKRDDLRWGKEPDWYINHIWLSHIQYGKSVGEKIEYLNLDGSASIDHEKIINYLKMR